MMVIGCFEVLPLNAVRWKVTNTLTTFVHITYGTEAEVRAELERQSAEWVRKYADKAAGIKPKRGSGWRVPTPPKPEAR